jgi:glutamyl-tRNA reductase
MSGGDVGPQGGLIGRSQESPLMVVGCDFRRASSAWREALLTSPEDRLALHDAIRRNDPEAGFMAVETCNRVEWVVATEDAAWIGELLHAQMLDRWCTRFGDDVDLPALERYSGRAAAVHLFRVAAGLESLAQGEAEIAGQLQSSLQRAQDEATSTRVLNGLGRFMGGIAKTSQRMGFRNSFNRGIHVLTAWFLEKRLGAGATRTVAVAGMGEIGRKAADFIEHHLGYEVLRFNRTLEGHEEIWRPLADLPDALAGADALVIATGARSPVLNEQTFAARGADDPLLVMDLGIPQQVVPAAREMAGVAYHPVDALVEVRSADEDAARDRLEDAITQQVARFNRFCLERHVVGLLRVAQEKRLDLVRGDVDVLVREKMADADPATQARVADLLREVVRSYAYDVFQSVHDALEEGWKHAREQD